MDKAKHIFGFLVVFLLFSCGSYKSQSYNRQRKTHSNENKPKEEYQNYRRSDNSKADYFDENPSYNSNTDSNEPDRLVPNVYKVAVLLPFDLDKRTLLSSLNNTGLQRFNPSISVELYKGIKQALFLSDQFQPEIEIEVYNSTDQYELEQKLSSGFFKDVSLFIGPIFPEKFEKVSLYAKNTNKLIVNPLSNELSSNALHENVVLLNPPNREKINVLFNELEQGFRSSNIILISDTSDTSDDQLVGLMEQLSLRSPIQVNTMNWAPGEELFSEEFLEEGVFDESYVFLYFGTETINVSEICRLLTIYAQDMPIRLFGLEDWLKPRYQSDLNYLNKLKFTFASNLTPDYYGQDYQVFEQNFKVRNSYLPTVFAAKGAQAFNISVKLLTEIFATQDITSGPQYIGNLFPNEELLFIPTLTSNYLGLKPSLFQYVDYQILPIVGVNY